MVKVTYSIFNTQIKGEISGLTTVTDLINYIQWRHGHGQCAIDRDGRLLRTDTLLETGHYSVTSPFVQSKMLTAREFIPPDEKPYSIGICEIELCTGTRVVSDQSSFSHRSPIFSYVRHLVKILRDTPEEYVIKLLTPKQINDRPGPTLPSLYAHLSKSSHEIHPYIMYHRYIEPHILAGHHNYEAVANPFKWRSISAEPCVVCLENPGNMGHLNAPDISVCRGCSEKLPTCPSCRALVMEWLPVTFL